MTDIFVSCAHDDLNVSPRLVESLRAVGYKVTVPFSGVSADELIGSENSDLLSSAKVVLIIWTRQSLNSERVLAEAHQAVETGKYIGVMLERGLDIPLEFKEFQAADMSGNDREPEEFDWLCGAIDTIISVSREVASLKDGVRGFATSDAESAIWYRVSKSNTVADYEFYLNQYGRRGAFSRQARERRRSSTTWAYRLGQFTNAGWVKGLAATVIVGSAAALFAVNNSKATMVPQEHFAQLRNEALKLKSDLAAANDSRLTLIASFGDKVSRSEYSALNERAKKLEQQLEDTQLALQNEPSIDFLDGGEDRFDGGGFFAQLDQNLDNVLGGRYALETAVGGIEPASGSRLTCTIDGNRGIRFASSCWPRNVNELSLNGLGTEFATTLEPVEMLRELETLDIAGAVLSDLDPLSSMNSLRNLNLSGTAIETIGPLASLTNLETLDVSGTKVTDLSPLKEMRNLKSFCPPSGPCILEDADKVQSYLDEAAR